MLDDAIQAQLKAYLERLQRPIELVASLDDSANSQQMHTLLTPVAALSDKGQPAHRRRQPAPPVVWRGPADIARASTLPACRWAMNSPRWCWPAANRRASAQGRTSGHRPDQGGAAGQLRLRPFISLSCHNCPDVVQALNLMAVLNPGVTSTMIDGALFQGRSQRPPDHGRAHRLPERRQIRPGPHDRGRSAGPGGHRCQRPAPPPKSAKSAV